MSVYVKCPHCTRLCEVTKRGTIERHRRYDAYSSRGATCDGAAGDAVPLLGVEGGPLETLRAYVAGHDERVAAIRARADEEIARATRHLTATLAEINALDKLVAKRAIGGAA